MASPKEYFEKDGSTNLRGHITRTFTSQDGREQVEVIESVAFDFDAGVRFALVYIPESSLTAFVIAYFLQNIGDVLKAGEGVKVEMGFHGTDERISSDDLDFSGRIFVYTPKHFTVDEKTELRRLATTAKLKLVIRDGNYLDQRTKMDVPQAFISHDSRDKEPFVRELAAQLQKMIISVWYDEYSLKPGDSLRASIEKGLKECKKVILVLSPNFFANKGWTKAEFDSVFTREILEKQNVIIPIWHGVGKHEVYNYSPRLLDKVGIPSTLPIEEIAHKIVQTL